MCCPMQLCGPLENGMKIFGFAFALRSHRVMSNSWGFSKYFEFRKFPSRLVAIKHLTKEINEIFIIIWIVNVIIMNMTASIILFAHSCIGLYPSFSSLG